MLPADAHPACADNLPLVDAAMERGKAANVAARELARLCRSGCPCAGRCLNEMVTHPEHGVWGGTRRVVEHNYRPGRLKVVA